MEMNITLLGQMITFAVFVWFTMRYVWPPIMKAMKARQQRISEGLEAAEQGKRELELAQHKSNEIIRDAKAEASHIVEQANNRAAQILEEAKEDARQESQKILNHAQQEVEQLKLSAKEELRNELSSLVVDGAERIVRKEVDAQTHKTMLDELMTELS